MSEKLLRWDNARRTNEGLRIIGVQVNTAFTQLLSNTKVADLVAPVELTCYDQYEGSGWHVLPVVTTTGIALRYSEFLSWNYELNWIASDLNEMLGLHLKVDRPEWKIRYKPVTDPRELVELADRFNLGPRDILSIIDKL